MRTPLLAAASGVCSSGPTCSFLSLGSDDSLFVWHGDAGTEFRPATATPEPMSLALLGLGLVGLGVARRRKAA